MEKLSFDEVVTAVHGSVYCRGTADTAENVSTDTRKIQKDSIFIALKGNNFDGNCFVLEASKKGAAICIIDEIKFDKTKLDNYTSIVVVKDCKRALLDLAGYYRTKLNIKVVGITGSTGKTSTKDLTAAALSGKYNVFKTQGNFNNEIGLPLMIFNIDNRFDVAVLEMGMSNFKEIHNMVEAARPDMALITNIGISHIENLKTQENILKAKLEITDFFTKDNVLILNGDDPLLSNVEGNEYGIRRTGTSCLVKCDLQAVNIKTGEKCVDFDVITSQGLEHYHIDMPGKHNVLNAMLAIECAKQLGLCYNEICLGLKNIEPTSMRLDIIQGSKIAIINDCYNASPDSMKAAIDVLCDMECRRKVAVLGTMKELGEHAFNAHKSIGSYVAEKKVDLLVTIGEYNNAFEEGFNITDHNSLYKSFDAYDDAVKYIKDYISEGDAVLVKASRSMKFETIVNQLVQVID